MAARDPREARKLPKRHESDFTNGAKAVENLAFRGLRLGQGCPQQCPRSAEGAHATVVADSLGEPMTIGQVASLLGCSAWTVRQLYLRQGLPYLRANALGRLVFFREQVIDWILERQQRQKGGIR
jgi:hypothetical protein